MTSPSDDTLAMLVDTYTRSAWLRPDSEVTDTPTWFQVRTPSAKFYSLNCVRRAVCSTDDFDARLEELIADHAERDAHLNWAVTPVCRPLDLPDRLRARGFVPTGTTVGMVRPTSPLPMPPGVVVADIAAEGAAGVDDYMRASVAGWSTPAAAVEQIRTDVARSVRRGIDNHYLVARIDGVPAGAGALVLMPGRGYLLGGAVAPEYRGRGVYRALVSARLALLAERNVKLATIVAIETTSAPICRQLGFVDVCQFKHFRWSNAGP